MAMGPEPKAAAKSEISQCLRFKTFHGLNRRDLLSNKLAQKIYSMMFLRQKRTGKWKARLVAGGNRQDTSIYSVDQISSPTVTTQSVFMLSAIAATQRHDVMTVDITGAYLHCEVKEDIYMQLDPVVSQILLDLDPDGNWEEYQDPSGKIWVQLDRALYGLVESARLFYDHLCNTLTHVGFAMNPYDQCVFTRSIGSDKQYVCFHVDDLLCTATHSSLNEQLLSELLAAYPESVNRNNPSDTVIDYLGMDLDFKSTPGQVSVSQSKYIQKILDSDPVEGLSATPARNDLHDIYEHSPALDKSASELFHSTTAKLLYLSKRGRPEIQPVVAFLTTRVSLPTVQDRDKLDKCLKYLRRTIDKTLILDASGGRVTASVDSAYGVHSDAKSHTGACISLGRGVVFATSVKQRIVTKSSTEAEIVAVSDALSQILWTKHFLDALGWNVDSAIVLDQDNKSAILAEENGRNNSNSRMKHVKIRYFFIKQYVDDGEIIIRYMPTENITADVLTKPLQGQRFRTLRNQLLGATSI
jgi:hypothetical protein